MSIYVCELGHVLLYGEGTAACAAGLHTQAGWEAQTVSIPTIRDRVVQTSAMLVLEPIFEADHKTEKVQHCEGNAGEKRIEDRFCDPAGAERQAIRRAMEEGLKQAALYNTSVHGQVSRDGLPLTTVGRFFGDY